MDKDKARDALQTAAKLLEEKGKYVTAAEVRKVMQEVNERIERKKKGEDAAFAIEMGLE